MEKILTADYKQGWEDLHNDLLQKAQKKAPELIEQILQCAADYYECPVWQFKKESSRLRNSTLHQIRVIILVFEELDISQEDSAKALRMNDRLHRHHINCARTHKHLYAKVKRDFDYILARVLVHLNNLQ